jgi:hypothetical protein
VASDIASVTLLHNPQYIVTARIVAGRASVGIMGAAKDNRTCTIVLALAVVVGSKQASAVGLKG